jgi:hypothetical protein
MYAYSRQCLIQYGTWMLRYERPYFDQIEALEFPTEAWPAQDLRKANALRLAAQLVDEPLRTRMFERGDELAERAWRDLWQFPTRTTARAMAIVFTEGLRDAELRSRQCNVAPPVVEPPEFPPAEPFLPQRERIRHKLGSPSGLISLLVAAANPVRWSRLWQHP